MNIRYSIPGALPSLNALLRMHWAKRKRLKDQYILMMPNPWEPEKKKMTVRICVYQPARRFDIDNLHGAVKPIIDALRCNNIIYRDSPNWIDLRLTQAIDRKNPRVEITVEEVGR